MPKDSSGRCPPWPPENGISIALKIYEGKMARSMLGGEEACLLLYFFITFDDQGVKPLKTQKWVNNKTDGKNANLSPSLSIIDGHIRSSDGAFFVAAAASSSNYAEIEALLLPPPPLHAPLPAFFTTQVEILGFQLVSISLFPSPLCEQKNCSATCGHGEFSDAKVNCSTREQVFLDGDASQSTFYSEKTNAAIQLSATGNKEARNNQMTLTWMKLMLRCEEYNMRLMMKMKWKMKMRKMEWKMMVQIMMVV
nr:uncharacterized protein LOC113742220 [Coffea arabica]